MESSAPNANDTNNNVSEEMPVPPPSPLSESPEPSSPEPSSPVSVGSVSMDEDEEEGDEMFHEIENELVTLNLDPKRESLQEEELQMEVTSIKESLKESAPELEEVPLNEEPDTLSPLLVDNHTLVQHQEMLVGGHYCDDGGLSKRTLNPLARSFMLRDADSSDEGQKEGKLAEDEGPMEIPDDETCAKIVEQVEFYFSNESLLKDAFLLKHVRRNKEGFVSLKLVSSFKRVRQVCKDWRAVGYAIKKCSQRIEMNDLGSKIRRLEPLPLYDETLPSRTIVATGLPFDKLTIEKVSDIFSRCGEIALVRILRPGGQIPADVRQFMNKHPELLESECALVEFVESSSARVAQKMEGIYVLELVLPKKKTGKKAVNVTRLVESLKYSSESDSERARGGENVRFLKRNNSVFYVKPEFVPAAPRRSSFGEASSAFETFQAKRFHNMQTVAPPPIPERRFSNCSDGYSSCNEMSRRPSSELSRRFSNTSDFSRRYSNCSDGMCSCSRRSSEVFRRISNGSTPDTMMMPRKFSSERRFSNASDRFQSERRISMEHERKISSGSGVYERKYSNGFDPFRKLSSTNDQYCNGRRISTDSGYDRRTSFGSDVSAFGTSPVPQSPIMSRPRQGSLFSNESVVRTPIGPDGSKGFARARRIGQVVPPV